MKKLRFLCVLFILNCSTPQKTENPSSAEKVCDEQSIMATAWRICVIDPQVPKDKLQSMIKVAMDEVRRIDLWMSEWKNESLVSEINRQAGLKAVPLTDEAYEVFKVSLDHSEKTHGAFDISFNAFFGEYSWKKGAEKFPNKETIRKKLPLVNFRNVVLDDTNKTVFLKKKGMKIGFGGMGQGWAVDRAVKILRDDFKVQAGFVDGSGDTYFWGKKPDQTLWTVGIADPRSETKDILFKLYLTDRAVTTAGDTEKFFVRDGVRYHHIIDPRTGDSARSSAQVTAICKTATLCDIADDGIFILGPREGMKYAKEIDVRAVLIEPNGVVNLSKGVKPVQTPWGRALEIDGEGAR